MERSLFWGQESMEHGEIPLLQTGKSESASSPLGMALIDGLPPEAAESETTWRRRVAGVTQGKRPLACSLNVLQDRT